jgi:hypothetical protein
VVTTVPTIPSEATTVIDAVQSHALSLGVEMVLEWEGEKERLTFFIDRHDAPKGSGAAVLRRLVELADRADLGISIDVVQSNVRLVRYYWDFGFRVDAGDHASETAAIVDMVEQQTRTAERDRLRGIEIDFGVTTMWRERWAGPLTAPANGATEDAKEELEP